jgi:hypothetical protein
MNIVFLFSGQSRTFPFSHNRNGNHIQMLERYNKFIFTEKFKSMYKYKIYITTDDLQLSDTISYFGDNNIGNIHLLNTNYYKKNVNIHSKNIETYFDKYNINADWSNGYAKYDNSIQQHYKIMDCYNLFINDSDSDINITNCDFIIRLRLDLEFTLDILDILEKFKIDPKIEIIMDWDFLAIGKPKIMECYCNGLNNNYGKYKYLTPVPDVPPIMGDYHTIDKYIWTYAPERQLFEMLFEYCNKNNIDMNDAIKQVVGWCKHPGLHRLR